MVYSEEVEAAEAEDEVVVERYRECPHTGEWSRISNTLHSGGVQGLLSRGHGGWMDTIESDLPWSTLLVHAKYIYLPR